VDGVTLIQEYVRAPAPFITRVEFIGSEFLYAVQVDTSLGFELCRPTCARSATRIGPVGTAPIATIPSKAAPRFRILPEFRPPDPRRLTKNSHGQRHRGRRYRVHHRPEGRSSTPTTSTRTRTTISAAEAVAQKFGMKTVARFLGRELHKLEDRTAPARPAPLAQVAAR